MYEYLKISNNVTQVTLHQQVMIVW